MDACRKSKRVCNLNINRRSLLLIDSSSTTGWFHFQFLSLPIRGEVWRQQAGGGAWQWVLTIGIITTLCLEQWRLDMAWRVGGHGLVGSGGLGVLQRAWLC